ncbi:HET-domain-containing protein [Hypoxylon crocopeplum]|nr:HET-domain-containing protein [Hypoxylon crocopeplum]
MLCIVCKDALENISTATRLCSVENHITATQVSTCCYDRLDDLPVQKEFRYVYGHHLDEESFTRSARQGCVMCSDFSFNDEQDDQTNRPRSFGFFTVFWISYENFNPCMNVDSGYGVKSITLIPARTLSILDNTLNSDLSSSTDSAQTWSLICNWMQTCSRFHHRCKRTVEDDSYRPTRLLEIKYPPDPHSQSPPTFRLVGGEQCSQSSSYVALSYRWGNKPLDNVIQLLEWTSAWLEMPNPISHLPKTFRDAMHIAHRFGIRYLWIDRLCIYQDSSEDWRREAGIMQDVYRNASFCVSALGAEDDEGGCFFGRDACLVAPTAVNLNRMGKYFRAEIEDVAWHTAFRNEPLIQRGWVLQERLMAPRAIYFGSQQVFWECSEAHACETHPGGFGKFSPANESPGIKQPKQRDCFDKSLWKQLIATPTSPRPSRDRRVEILANWSAIVNLYSTTQLTFPRDKLVAVSGLAKEVRKSLQRFMPGRHQYFAGLWKDMLVETLGWYVRIGAPAIRTPSYRAPSWSWASLDGHVIMPEVFTEETTELSSLLSVGTEFLGEDDTREVKGGMLTLYGPTCLVETSASEYNRCTIKAFWRFKDDRRIKCSKTDQRWTPDPTVILDTTEDIGNELFCIWTVAQPATLGGWQASGLALQCVHVDSNIFRRIGIVSCYYQDQPSLEKFVDALPRREVTII